MLFDLQGRRRRVVQATYLGLAILMGGGLVFFGIGGDVQGGLFDAIGERGGNAGSITEKTVERAEKRLQANPSDAGALKELIRGHYQLATEDADPNTGAFGEEGRKELQKAAGAWERYLATDPAKPDDGLATLALRVYSEVGLNQPDKAAEAAEIVAESRPSPSAFLQLTRYAQLAGQTRKADLAGKKAVELASPRERKQVKLAVDQALAAAAQAQAQAGGGATAP